MKPSIPKGTRDFSPQQMVKRNYIFDTIKQVFQRYGYMPIETPAMENLSTLMGKYGDEGDKLIFKILNSGDFMSKVRNAIRTAVSAYDLSLDEITQLGKEQNYTPIISYAIAKAKEKEILDAGENWIVDGSSFTNHAKKIDAEISEKALRYDLTVPFARYVVQHQNEISFPFKRYQIQPVWRADRPQKGRYREFYQCDADVIGSSSLINEVELIQMIDDVFTKLGVNVIIKINNRKILSGIAEIIGAPDRMVDIAIAIDKYDKIGEDGVNKELEEKGFSKVQIQKLHDIFMMHVGRVSFGDGIEGDSNLKNLYFLKTTAEYQASEIFLKGIEEMEFVFNTVNNLNLSSAKIEFDITLARGLNYYTGAIFEVKANEGTFTSSISGGGRYDDLTGIFGLPNMSGVGISFGADRIYDVLEELNKFPTSVTASTKLLFVTFGEQEMNYCLPLLSQVRKSGINAEVYPDAGAKMKKQMGYADDKKIPYVVIIGGDEMQSGLLSLKDMTSGNQQKMMIDDILKKLG